MYVYYADSSLSLSLSSAKYICLFHDNTIYHSSKIENLKLRHLILNVQ